MYQCLQVQGSTPCSCFKNKKKLLHGAGLKRRKMRRLAYIIIGKDGNIFMDNKVFKSLKKAEKQIDYSVKKQNFYDVTWEAKKVIIDGSSKNKKVNHDWYFLGFFCMSILLIVLFTFLIVFMQPLVKNLDITEEINTILFTLLYLSGIGLGCILMGISIYLKKLVICMLDTYYWIKYIREDTSNLEVYYFNNYSKLEKTKYLKEYDVKDKEGDLEEKNEQ
jgi:hypothetical protein